MGRPVRRSISVALGVVRFVSSSLFSHSIVLSVNLPPSSASCVAQRQPRCKSGGAVFSGQTSFVALDQQTHLLAVPFMAERLYLFSMFNQICTQTFTGTHQHSLDIERILGNQSSYLRQTIYSQFAG